jgi:hypothetical protein
LIGVLGQEMLLAAGEVLVLTNHAAYLSAINKKIYKFFS